MGEKVICDVCGDKADPAALIREDTLGYCRYCKEESDRSKLIADEAWEFWKVIRRSDWSEEQNIKALVRGAVTDPLHKVKNLKKALAAHHDSDCLCRILLGGGEENVR